MALNFGSGICWSACQNVTMGLIDVFGPLSYALGGLWRVKESGFERLRGDLWG